MESYLATPEWPYHISCGGPVYRQTNGQREYALLYRGKRFGEYGDSWHLPKGTLHKNETLEQGAVREIREESGLSVEIQGYLGSLKRKFLRGIDIANLSKVTHYFLTKYQAGDSGLMDGEHDELRWVSAQEAYDLLSK